MGTQYVVEPIDFAEEKIASPSWDSLLPLLLWAEALHGSAPFEAKKSLSSVHRDCPLEGSSLSEGASIP
jgi:hypothetical protein